MTETTLAQAPVHGRRRAAASPFDEIARTGSDGQPYWSARDLAKLFGYDRWSNFADAINRARRQVESHVSAGQSNSAGVGNNGSHFLNAEIASKVGFGERMIPDVHLTRFAAYFVALNADQSKPEVKAAVNYYFVGRTIQAETMVTAGAADPMLTAQVAERLAAMEATLAGLPEAFADIVRDALAVERKPEFVTTADGQTWSQALFDSALPLKTRRPEPEVVEDAPAPTGLAVGDWVPDSFHSVSRVYAEVRGLAHARGGGLGVRILLREGIVDRVLHSKKAGGRSVYRYRVTARGRGLVVLAGRGGRGGRARVQENGTAIQLTPAGQEWAKRAFAKD